MSTHTVRVTFDIDVDSSITPLTALSLARQALRKQFRGGMSPGSAEIIGSGGRPATDPAIVAEARRLYSGMRTIREVSEALGISKDTVARIVRHAPVGFGGKCDVCGHYGTDCKGRA